MLAGTAAFLFPRKLPSHPCCRGPENLFYPKLKGMFGWELSGLAAAKLISFVPKIFCGKWCVEVTVGGTLENIELCLLWLLWSMLLFLFFYIFNSISRNSIEWYKKMRKLRGTRVLSGVWWRSQRKRTDQGFPGDSEGKLSACNAGDLDSIPRSGRSPGGGSGFPLQYSCLENPVDRGAWQATVHGVAKNRTRLKWLRMHTCRK